MARSPSLQRPTPTCGVEFPHLRVCGLRWPVCLQMGMYDDKVGPTVIAILVLLTLITMFALAIYDFLY